MLGTIVIESHVSVAKNCIFWFVFKYVYNVPFINFFGIVFSFLINFDIKFVERRKYFLCVSMLRIGHPTAGFYLVSIQTPIL